MQQAFKTMMGQMGSQNNQFSNAAFPSGSPFGSPPPSTLGPSIIPSFPYQLPATSGPNASGGTAGYAYSPPSTSGQSILNDAPSSAAKSQAMPPSPAAFVTMDVSTTKPEVVKPVAIDESETKTKAKQSAFSDISPEETLRPSPFENYDDTSSRNSSSAPNFAKVVHNGSVSKESTSSEWSQETIKETRFFVFSGKFGENDGGSKYSEDDLSTSTQGDEKSSLLQIDNMGERALDSGVMERLKGFDLNSPEVKQQFDQIGLGPEEAMSRIILEPEIAKAFQNPRIQHAIMDCSQNPMNMIKYRDDKEVMAVFNKLQELFPGSSGF